MSWGLASMVLLLFALGTQLLAFERGQMSARSLALVAALAALAVAGRLAFAPLSNVKPTTDIVLIAGFALGASPGFAVGALTALVSNMVFGQGPWTPWQMFAWGLVSLFGALLATLLRGFELHHLVGCGEHAHHARQRPRQRIGKGAVGLR